MIGDNYAYTYCKQIVTWFQFTHCKIEITKGKVRHILL